MSKYFFASNGRDLFDGKSESNDELTSDIFMPGKFIDFKAIAFNSFLKSQ